LRSPQKAQLCNPCLRNELSPLSQEGQITEPHANRRRDKTASTPRLERINKHQHLASGGAAQAELHYPDHTIAARA
jgi:hypothetical protein